MYLTQLLFRSPFSHVHMEAILTQYITYVWKKKAKITFPFIFTFSKILIKKGSFKKSPLNCVDIISLLIEEISTAFLCWS